MRFLVDNQLPVALARFLAESGFECAHVLDLDLYQASDAAIWQYAEESCAVVVSKVRDCTRDCFASIRRPYSSAAPKNVNSTGAPAPQPRIFAAEP